MKKSYNYALCYNRLARGKGKKVKFVLKTFFSALAALAMVWRWLVSGFNCFKAAEHGGKADRLEQTSRNIYTYINEVRVKLTQKEIDSLPVSKWKAQLDINGDIKWETATHL